MNLQTISYQTRTKARDTKCYQTKAQNMQLSGAMEAVAWPPIKAYRQQELSKASQNDDEQLRARIEILVKQNDQLCKIILRLRSEIRFQIRFWNRGLKYGEWESRENVKRRLSTLRGSLEYLWSQVSLELQAKDKENLL